jgi:hypothetical protein
VESSPDAAHSAVWREKQIVVAGHVIHAMFVAKHIVVPQLETTKEIAFATMWRPLNALLKGDCRWCDQGLGQEVFLNGCRKLLSCNWIQQPISPLFFKI